jgi:hypothetical protein
MKTLVGPVVTDGDEVFVAVPEARTVQLYKYLRGFGFCFIVDCRGFCEDNVFLFHENENVEKLNAILAAFPSGEQR